MKDKQIKIEKTIFYMLLLLVMVYRGVILFKYSFYYVDDDQALMWYGTVSFAHFDFHEPCFFGQSYGSMIESRWQYRFIFFIYRLKWHFPFQH